VREPAHRGCPTPEGFLARRRLASLHAPGALEVMFQPIFERRPTGLRFFGVEGLVRGPKGSTLRDSSALFEFARRRHAECLVDRLCISAVFQAASGLGSECPLAVNVHGATLGRDRELSVFLGEVATSCGIALERVILEVVDQPPSWYNRSFGTNVEGLKSIGVRLAVDFGARASGFRGIVDCAPDYLKLDRYLVRGVRCDHSRRAVVGASVALAAELGARVVAEGIEDPADLDTMATLGVELVQGHAFCGALPVAVLQASGLFSQWRPES
jgi:EAL domain-containing protein (putative c-di-GMP-specific phosphodiesterase class I)